MTVSCVLAPLSERKSLNLFSWSSTFFFAWVNEASVAFRSFLNWSSASRCARSASATFGASAATSSAAPSTALRFSATTLSSLLNASSACFSVSASSFASSSPFVSSVFWTSAATSRSSGSELLRACDSLAYASEVSSRSPLASASASRRSDTSASPRRFSASADPFSPSTLEASFRACSASSRCFPSSRSNLRMMSNWESSSSCKRAAVAARTSSSSSISALSASLSSRYFSDRSSPSTSARHSWRPCSCACSFLNLSLIRLFSSRNDPCLSSQAFIDASALCIAFSADALRLRWSWAATLSACRPFRSPEMSFAFEARPFFCLFSTSRAFV
mmetsp:Transcript_22126/g.62217  ORF Transcript_22126/g.62217 Transcript_22126/m.62217 type:complete len:333 (-) Transcript_22126:820-1818(-)